MILAFLAFIAGWHPVAQYFLVVPQEERVLLVPGLALLALIFGAGLAIFLYRSREAEPLHLFAVRQCLYVDEFYSWLINHTQEFLARVAATLDRSVLDAGAVRGASSGAFGIGSLLRLFQVGNIQAYAFLFGLGIVALIYFTIFR